MEKLREEDAGALAEIFHLLGDANRLRVFYACLKGPVSAGALAEGLDMGASLVSHHLRRLKTARILTSERRGRQIFYGAVDGQIRDMVQDMVFHIKADQKTEGP